jgi:hypothetical protein
MRVLPAGRFEIHLLITKPYSTAKTAAVMAMINSTDITSPNVFDAF